jgi:hypothetical protein
MAESETEDKQSKLTAQSKSKRKSGRLSEVLIVAFVLVGTLLVLVEMGTNVVNELESQRANAISSPQLQPTATATLTPEELQIILRENSQTN